MSRTTFVSLDGMVTLSEARARLGELVERELPMKGEIYLVKYNRPVAKLSLVGKRVRGKEWSAKKVIDKYFGAIPDFPDVTRYRRSREKPVSL